MKQAFFSTFVIFALFASYATAEENSAASEEKIYRSRSGGSASNDIIVKRELPSSANSDESMKARPSTETMEEASKEKRSEKKAFISRSGGSSAAQAVEVPVK